MASSGLLYMKGMNQDDSEEDMEDGEDKWDDTKLNAAYDKALKMANLEVAKRLAMATNSVGRKKDKPGENSQSPSTPPRANKPRKKGKANKALKKELTEETQHEWKEGMACRAMYCADGFEYEATVVTIIDDASCLIKYLGYNNTEILPISCLQPSLGKQARKDQMMEANSENDEDESSTLSTYMDNELSDGTQVKQAPSRKQRVAKEKRREVNNKFVLPNTPMPEVSSILREFGHMEMPTPPPPLMSMQGPPSSTDDEALSNMLVSWYMSGYYTGLYHGKKRAGAPKRERYYS